MATCNNWDFIPFSDVLPNDQIKPEGFQDNIASNVIRFVYKHTFVPELSWSYAYDTILIKESTGDYYPLSEKEYVMLKAVVKRAPSDKVPNPLFKTENKLNTFMYSEKMPCTFCKSPAYIYPIQGNLDCSVKCIGSLNKKRKGI